MSAQDNDEDALDKARSALTRANRLAAKTRKEFDNWLQTSLWGYIFDVCNSIFSLISVAFYVTETYYDPNRFGKGTSTCSDCTSEDHAVWVLDTIGSLELYITFFFFFDYIIHLYAAESRLRHILRVTVMIDLITVLPSLTIFFIKFAYSTQTREDSSLRTASQLGFLRFIRVLKVLRVLRLLRVPANGRPHVGTEVSRQVITVVLTSLCLIFCFAGLFQIVELSFKSLEDLEEEWGSNGFAFHDAIYFTIITVTTVGYGDYYPTTVLGKFLTIAMILFSLAIVSDQVNKLMALLSLASPWARASYKAHKNAPHVILCGSINFQSANDFLSEFFHPDHGATECKLVIIGAGVPSPAVLWLLRSPEYVLRVVYLEGSVLVDKDLHRAAAAKAKAAFVLCDKFAEEPYQEDTANIIRAISMKKYVSQHTGGQDLPMILQLVRPDTRHHFTASVYGSALNQIVCMDEIKMNLLGKSCLCPGFSSFICNLMRSSSVNFEDGTGNSPGWLSEYLPGCGKEIYFTTLSSAFGGRVFNDVTSLLYREFKCILFAIEIRDSQGFSRVVLNPARYRIPIGQTSKVYLIADDAEDADAVRSYGAEEDILDEDAMPGDPTVVEKYADEQETQIRHSNEIMERLKIAFHVEEIASTLAERTWATLDGLQGHILLCGTLNACNHFVATLRPKHLHPSTLFPIVILHPEPPSPVLWAELCHFPKLYFVQGSPLDPGDLVRAGVFGLSKAIVLSNSQKMTHSEEEEAQNYLVDADAIFVYQSISKVRPEAHIQCELVNSDNVSFLMPDDERLSDYEHDPTMSPPFAAGMVYINAILDRLSCQAYYNPNLVRILRELVVSNDSIPHYSEANVHPSELTFFPVPHEFHGKAYVQLFQYLVLKCMALPLGLYRDSPWNGTSPMPYVITNPDADLILHEEDFVYTLQSPEIDGATTGFLEVYVVRARNLLHEASTRSCAFYCEVKMGDVTQTTDVMYDTAAPQWNHRMTFSIRGAHMGSLEVAVYDKKKLDRVGTTVGSVSVDINDFLWKDQSENDNKLGSVEKWMMLTGGKASSRKGKASLCLRMSFSETKIRATQDVSGSGGRQHKKPAITHGAGSFRGANVESMFRGKREPAHETRVDRTQSMMTRHEAPTSGALRRMSLLHHSSNLYTAAHRDQPRVDSLGAMAPGASLSLVGASEWAVDSLLAPSGLGIPRTGSGGSDRHRHLQQHPHPDGNRKDAANGQTAREAGLMGSSELLASRRGSCEAAVPFAMMAASQGTSEADSHENIRDMLMRSIDSPDGLVTHT